MTSSPSSIGTGAPTTPVVMMVNPNELGAARKAALTEYLEEGGTVHNFSAEEHKRLMAIYAPLGDKVLGSDPVIAPMYNLIKAAAKETM